jgi:hypothetical protein
MTVPCSARKLKGTSNKGAVTVAFKMAKEHGAFFGAAHIFLKFPFPDCVERLFVHTGAPAASVRKFTLAYCTQGQPLGSQAFARRRITLFKAIVRITDEL